MDNYNARINVIHKDKFEFIEAKGRNASKGGAICDRRNDEYLKSRIPDLTFYMVILVWCVMSKVISLLLEDLIHQAKHGPIPAKMIEEYKTRLIQVARERKLNKKACAAVLGVSPRTIDYWIKDWGLPVRYRPGPNTKKRPSPYFELDEVLTWHHLHQSEAHGGLVLNSRTSHQAASEIGGEQ